MESVTDNVTQNSTLVSTRRALHAVAEHVLAGDLWRNTGRIGLRLTDGGFGQPEVLIDGERRRLRIDLDRIVVLRGDVEEWEALTTLADAAAFSQAMVGAPAGVYVPETSLDPDASLGVDPGSARQLADWFALVNAALEEFRRRHAVDAPSMVQLWPEHFDLACSMSEINFGGSPGDAEHDVPYLYVAPWSVVPSELWNESWGVSAPWTAVCDVRNAVAFLETGLDAARTG